ncbi:hypothetical protein [Paracoccus sp. (in: a-proteobacteria)]|uniref:hypothetical protein n=1 Tax=Paracoccus sp. TaxID=267 RepID=UPI0026DF503F|nr:hypothetical protein [Paracoccus sp. (in: a-proteobacteria)]MDO5647363.1 hypothetical protein [Paracoccus sp. (in: a-proteobacteria)]
MIGIASGMWMPVSSAALPNSQGQEPHRLTAYYESGAIPIHFRATDLLRDGDNLVGFRNGGAAGALFNAAVRGAVSTDGDWITVSDTGAALTLPHPADLQGARLFMVVRNLTLTGDPGLVGHTELTEAGTRGINNEGNTVLRIRASGAVALRNRVGSWSGSDIPIAANWSGLTLLEVALHPTEIRARSGGDVDVVLPLSTAMQARFASLLLSEIASGGSVTGARGDYGDIVSVLIDHPDYDTACAEVRAYLRSKYESAAA